MSDLHPLPPTTHCLAEAPGQQRLIFCINSGRVGSTYLARLLGSAAETLGFHEPEPKMTGRYLELVHQFPYQRTFKERYIKVNALKMMLSALPQASVYCELNNMFIKTFFDVVLAGFPQQVEVIVLRRYLPHVLKSLIELGHFSGRNPNTTAWMTQPGAVTAALPQLDLMEHQDPYDYAIRYLIDIEARAQRFQADYPHIKLHPIRLEALNDLATVQQLFTDLHVTPTAYTTRLCSQKVNQKQRAKRNLSNVVDLDYCRDRIAQYIERAEVFGVSIPTTLALDEITEPLAVAH